MLIPEWFRGGRVPVGTVTGSGGGGLFFFWFFFHERAEPLDAFKRNVVFFHEFFKVVSFFSDEVPLAI